MVIRTVLNGNLEPVTFPIVTFEPFSSAARLSFGDVPGILNSPGHDLHVGLSNMARLADGLMARRRSAGALALYDLTNGWVTTEEGQLRHLPDIQETIGYVIVQELMVLANAELARLCSHYEIPILFRNHTVKAHAPPRMEVLSQLEMALKYPDAGIDALRQRLGMTMRQAEYGATLEGHYGLNLPAYMHATSPIRRYADLVNQRQIKAFFKGDKLPHTREDIVAIAEHINAKIAADKEDTTDFFKERAVKEATQALDSGNLNKLSPIQFERVIKTSVRSNQLSDKLGQSLRERIRDDRLTLLDMYYLLLETPHDSLAWRWVQEAIVHNVANNLYKATSIASVAMNLAGWSEVTYKTHRSGPDHAPVFSTQAKVTLKGGVEVKGGWVQANAIKEVRQKAVVVLLSRIANVASPIPWFAEYEEDLPVDVGLQPSVPKGDPVVMLQEYTQKMSIPLPEYTFSREGGPEHAPLFSCTCTVQIQGKRQWLTSMPVANKKEAKKQAAARVFQEVPKD